jgi:hypothetical protein
MRTALFFLAIFASAVPGLAQPQTIPAEAAKPKFADACGGKAAIKILDSKKLYLICGRGWTDAQGTLSDLSLYSVPAEAGNDPSVPNKLECKAPLVKLEGTGTFLTIWGAKLACDLAVGNTYQLGLAWTPHGSAAQPVKVAFDTKGSAALLDGAASIDSGRKLVLESNSMLRDAGFAISLLQGGVWKDIPGATLNTAGQVNSLVGHAEITLPFDVALSPGKYRVKIRGVTGSLNEAVEVDDTEKVEISSTRGNAKDDVLFYAKFGHQAGEGSKPAWILDLKSEIELPRRWKKWRLFPTITVDTGFGSAETNDSLKAGFGMRRLITGHGFLQAFVPSASAVYETDRTGGKRNLIADIDFKLLVKGTYNPLARRNRIALNDQMRSENNYQLEMEDLKNPKWIGYSLQAFVGSELGGALYSQEIDFQQTVDGSKVDKTLKLPQYGIVRLRPKVAAALEIRKLTLSATGTARYLANTEPTPRKLADKTYIQANRKGWLGYGEFSIAYLLKSVISVDVTYKVGAVPPVFQRVNTVQSGIVYHF